MSHEAQVPQVRSRGPMIRQKESGFDWRPSSRGDILSLFPDRDTRIRSCLDALLFFCAASCEWEDWRHLAQVHAETLVADLGIEPLRSPEQIFQEAMPRDHAGNPRITQVP